MSSFAVTGRSTRITPELPAVLIWAVPLILAAVIGLFTIDGELVLDDRGMIRGNPFITTGVPYSEAFQRDFLGRSLDRQPTVWRPLMPMVWKFIWGFAPNHPLPFRFLSLFLHVAATAIMLIAVRKIIRNEKVAWSGVCLFAVHPVHAEAIGGIVSQADILSAVLGMAATVIALRESPFRVRDMWLPAVLLAAACLAKESAVVFGVAIVAASSAMPSLVKSDRVYRIFPAFLVVVVVCVLQVSLERDPLLTSWRNNIAFDAHGMTRVLLGLHIVGKAATMCFVPVGLAANHGYGAIDLETGTLLPYAIPGFLYLLVACLGFYWALKNHKVEWAVGICILFGPIILQSNLLITVTTDLAERLLYASSIASSIMMAAFLWKVMSNPPACRATVVLLVILYAGQSWRVQRPWRDSLSVLRYSLTVEPLSWRIHFYYGREVMKTGDVEEGVWHVVISRYILSQYPKPINFNLLEEFENIPADQRSIEAPAILCPDNPCRFAVEVVVLLQDANAQISEEFKSRYIQRYGGSVTDVMEKNTPMTNRGMLNDKICQSLPTSG